MGTGCIYCGGTGIRLDGMQCDCGAGGIDIQVPRIMNIPAQYQGVKFDASFVPVGLGNYGSSIVQLIKEIISSPTVMSRNILVCAPPNSGKTIFAYTVIGAMYAKGVLLPDVMDLMQVRALLYDVYNQTSGELYHFNKARVVFVKVPQDLPNKWAETMLTIIDRRTRMNCSTFFLYSGAKADLIAQDKFKRFQSIIGDGSFNSVEVRSWIKIEKDE